MNERLRQAREDRRWSIDKAAEKCGISRTTYIRWEQGTQVPHDASLDMACNAFKMTPEQLGFKPYASNSIVPTSMMQTIIVPSSLLSGRDPSGNMISVGISALLLAQQAQGCTIEELLSLVGQEMRRIEMTQPSTEQKISRKEMLRLMMGLPAAMMGVAHLDNAASVSAEEALPLYVAGIPACWKLYYDGDFAEVERVLPSYIEHLTPLVHQSSRYQKTTASLVSQAHQLASLMVLEHEDFGASLNHCKQALSYGNIADDPNIQLGAYVRRANTLYYRKRFTQQLQNYQEALQVVNIEAASPLMQSRVYSGYAGILCKFDGNKQEALRYDGLAHDTFPDKPEGDPSFTFSNAALYVINLNSMVVHLDLGNPKAAETALIKAAQGVPKTANPRYIELLNHQALVSIAMNDLEQSCTYVETVATLGNTLGSDLYRSDARAIIDTMPDHWKHERRVKNVIELLEA